MSDNLRLVFAGTPDFAARHLHALISANMSPVAVYTQPDRPAGRGRKLQESAVKQVALQNGIPVLQPKSLKTTDAQDELRALEPDLLIVVAYGLILPQVVLDIPRLGCINVHASLLPQWRGAAPIQRAIEAGDEQGGVTIMQMDAGLDTGDMLLKAHCEIGANETGQSLHDKLAELGAGILPVAVQKLAAGELCGEQQNHDLATYANKLTKAEGLINWQDSAVLIDRKLRAFTPWPGSQCQLEEVVLKCQAKLLDIKMESEQSPGTILAADTDGLIVQTANGQIMITHLQFPGKRMLAVSDLLNAYASSFAVGNRFT